MLRSFLKVASGVALVTVLSTMTATISPALAEKCKFGDHERDENDPPLKCRKCEEIAKSLAEVNPHVWTLQIAYHHPRRVEVKREAGVGKSEVYWFIAYEVTNTDKVPRPCFIDVCAESDKGKNTYTYHDSIVPECKEEIRRILGMKEGETLYTQTEMCLPNQGEANALPNKDGAVKVGPDPTTVKQTPDPSEGAIQSGGNAKLALQLLAPGETRKCAACFGKLDTEFDVLTIFFQGLCNPVEALNPEASPVAEGEYRIVADDVKTADPYRRKIVERVLAIEFECLGDEFAKTTRSIYKHEEQLLRPINLNKDPDPAAPPRYHEVGVFGTEIIDAEEKTVEGKKSSPYTFLARKWIQVEKTIKSDLR
jgi:hypothetical protein